MESRVTNQQVADLMLRDHQKHRDPIKKAFARIAEIDAMVDMAGGWRSWMVSCANEREQLVNFINSSGGHAVHRYQARCNGRRTS